MPQSRSCLEGWPRMDPRIRISHHTTSTSALLHTKRAPYDRVALNFSQFSMFNLHLTSFIIINHVNIDLGDNQCGLYSYETLSHVGVLWDGSGIKEVSRRLSYRFGFLLPCIPR